jgi:hypothetical protein
MQTPKFQRNKEDFVCAHCGASVIGTGYTNHCPHCLWSKHVDIHPGDRAADCGGMMEPIGVEGTVARYRVLQRCQKCGFERRNDVQPEDNMESVVALAEKRAAA